MLSTIAVTSTETGKIISFNSKAEEFFGYTNAEVHGRNVKILMDKTIARQHDEYINTYLRSGNRRLIGKPRRVICMLKDETMVPIYLSLGEYYEDGKRKFLAQIQPRNSVEEKAASDDADSGSGSDIDWDEDNSPAASSPVADTPM